MSEDERLCPACGATQWAGMEYPRVYDGVLVWVCEPCGYARPREFTSWWRSARSREYADKINAARAAQLPDSTKDR